MTLILTLNLRFILSCSDIVFNKHILSDNDFITININTDTDTLLTKKHGPRKALMTYMYRWHKCQITRSHITNNKNIIVYINSNLYHNIWHFSHIILYQCINASVSPCTLVCYTYWLTCRQKQGNAIYGVRTVISINIYILAVKTIYNKTYSARIYYDSEVNLALLDDRARHQNHIIHRSKIYAQLSYMLFCQNADLSNAPICRNLFW